MVDAVAIHAIDTVDIDVEDAPWAWAEANRAAIESHWAALKRDKPFVFNGTVLLLARWSIEGATFRGAARRTDFASFMAWRDRGRPDDQRNFFALAALESRDGAFLLGEMGERTANAGRIYFPSGTPDGSDIRDGKVDLAGSVLRELAEETGLAADAVTVEPRWTVIEDGPRFAFMQRVRSALDADALHAEIDRFLAAEPEPEFARVHVVRRIEEAGDDRMPPFQRAYLRHALGQRTG